MHFFKNGILIIIVILGVISCKGSDLNSEQYYVKAKSHFAARQYNAAIIELKNSLQKNSENIEARFLLGQVYIILGDGISAEKEFKRVENAKTQSIYSTKVWLAKALMLQKKYQELIDKYGNATDTNLKIVLMEAYVVTGQLQKAKKILTAIAQANTQSKELSLAKARFNVGSGRYREAQTELSQLISADADDPQVWKLYGVLLIRLKQYQEAVDAFLHVVQLLSENSINTLEFESRIGLIQAYDALSKPGEVLQQIEVLQTKLPNHPIPKFLLAWQQYKKGDFESAIGNLQQVNKSVPGYLSGLLLLGATHYALGNYEQADSFLSQFVFNVPTHLQARKLLAATHIRQKKSDGTVTMLESMVSQQPDDSQLLAMISRAAILEGNPEKGIDYLKKAVQHQPDDSTLREELARIYISQGLFEQAIDELEAISVSASKNKDVLLILSYIKNGEFKKAQDYAQALTKNSNDPAVYTIAGSVYLMTDERGLAREFYNRAHKLDQSYIPAQLSLARLDIEEGELTRAEHHFDRILLTDGKNIAAMLGMAQVAERLRNTEQALKWLKHANEADKTALLPALILGRYYLRIRDVKTALRVLEESYEFNKDNYLVNNLYAGAVAASGKKNQALSIYEGMTKSFSNPAIYLNIGKLYIQLKDYNKARESINTALAKKKDFVEAKAALIRLDIITKSYDSALKQARLFQKSYPKISAGYLLLGDVYMQIGKYSLAQKSYKSAFDLSQSLAVGMKLSQAYNAGKEHKKSTDLLLKIADRAPENKLVHLQLANNYRLWGKLDEATAVLKPFLEKNPNDALILNNMAWFAFEAEDPKAVELAEKAYRSSSNSAAVADTLGWILLQTQPDSDRALKLLRQAADDLSDNQEVQYHYAVALLKHGNEEAAYKKLSKVVESGFEFSDLPEAKKLLRKISR